MKQAKNIKIFAAVLAAIVVLVGFSLLQKSEKKINQNTPQSNSNIISSSLDEVFNGRGSMECTFTNEDGQQYTIYIKNGKVRTDFEGGNEGSGGMIYTQDKVWTWDKVKKEGAIMTIPQVDEKDTTFEESKGETPVQSKEELKKEIEKYKESCKNTSVSDSLFTPPQDIKFIDMSELLKNMPMNQSNDTP